MKLKLLAAVAACAIALTACSGAESAAPSSESQSESQSQAEAVEEEEGTGEQEEALVMPVVAGSNAYDITVSLEQNGLPEATRTEASDGYTFTATNTEYSYTINTDKDYALSYAEYQVFGDDNGYLGFCASFPYDTADSEGAMDWVNSNIGTDAETTIGDATFTLTTNDQGPVLKVSAQGRDEYLMQKMEAAE